MKWWKQCPLLIILAISGIIFTIISAVNLNGVYREYEGKTFLTPVMTAFFQGVKEGNYPWSDDKALTREDGPGEERPDDKTDPEELAQDIVAETGSETAALQDVEEKSAQNADENEISEQESVIDEENQDRESGDSSFEETEPTEENMPEEDVTYEFVRVEEDYFDDALFIGDSRTQGLFEYGGMEERATFYCKTSLTIYDLFKKDKAFIKKDGESMTLTQALTERQFGKIYLMVGINELGTGTPEYFFEEYAKAVYKIRELQPDAIIFVEGIMRVASQKNASDPIFNNTGINIRNVEIETLADNHSIFYIDVNEAVCDENGNLHDDWTFDQIHLKARYYEIWKEFLLDHGIVRK